MTGNLEQGWYPDPAGVPHRLRWWDGSAWTGRTKDEADPEDGPEPEADDPFPAAARIPAAETAAAPLLAPVAPVLFEAVEPDRVRRRVVTGIAAVALAAVSVTGGYLWGAHGKSSGTTAEPVAVPPASAPPAPRPGAPAAESPAPAASGSPDAPLVPVTAGLVARWRLDEKSGSTAQDAAGRRPATVAGSVSWSADRGGSAVFAGNGSLATDGPVLDTAKSFTVTAWAKLADTGGQGMVVGQDGTQVSGFYLHFNQNAKTWAFARTSNDAANPTAWSTVTAQAPPKTGVWTHLTGTFDAATSRMVLYVDGVLQGELTHAAPWSAQGPFTIGRATSNVDRFRGSIADVEVFDRVLTAAEVRQLATPPKS
ncbi:LamG-like jellyroll fold domain-containing protein [Yinghuangia aomiensis]|uniref:LamG-like jellyroll fold domain-containing protein n=1 Tax=Yinghuangia aomiensis TaxID=676205 RepID=UPI0031E57AAF